MRAVSFIALCAFVAGSAMAPELSAQTPPKKVRMLGKRTPPPLDEACLDGFSHRLSTSSDWVCVSADTATRTRADNDAAASRRNPGGGAYGPDTCRTGFVWRGVTPNDHVCVTPDVRDGVVRDNSANASRKKKPWCEQYARQVMVSVVEAAKGACAQSNASLWSTNQSEHYTTCMGSPQTASNQANQARDSELKSCKTAAQTKAKAEQEAAERKAAEEQKAAEERKAAEQRDTEAKERKAREQKLANAKKEAEAKAAAKKAQEEQDKKEAEEKARKAKCEQGNLIDKAFCAVKSLGSSSDSSDSKATDSKKTPSK